jgi:hypothetical protein
MKHIKLTTLIFGLLLFGCNQADNKRTSVTEKKATTSANDIEQIQNLIRQVLNWADTKKSIDLLPVLADSRDSLYIGFDLDKHKQNLDKLQKTNFFATEFIENYNQIILNLDKGLRNDNNKQWLVGDLPTFNFSSGVNPWTLSQDIPYDDPNPFDYVEIKWVNIGSGELIWKWGKPELITEPSWKDFEYKFRVVKENDRWKISYLQGFDFKESTCYGRQL